MFFQSHFNFIEQHIIDSIACKFRPPHCHLNLLHIDHPIAQHSETKNPCSSSPNQSPRHRSKAAGLLSMFHTTCAALGWQNTSGFLSDRGNHEAVRQKQIRQNTHSIFASGTLTPALPLKDQTFCQIRPCPCPCSTPSVKVSNKGPHSTAEQSISISHIISKQNTSIRQIK